MARDDRIRRSFEAGTAFLDMSREKAEAMVKELVKAGELQKGKAQKAVEDLLDRSRKGAEQLRDLVRHEIAEQIAALGLATKDDLSRVEAKLDTLTATPSATKPPAAKKAVAKKAPGKAAAAQPPAGSAASAAGPEDTAAADPSPEPGAVGDNSHGD